MKIKLGEISMYDDAGEKLSRLDIKAALYWHELGETHLAPFGYPKGARAVEGRGFVRSGFRTDSGRRYYVTTFTGWRPHTLVTLHRLKATL
jgi:hypothetical protein